MGDDQMIQLILSTLKSVDERQHKSELVLQDVTNTLKSIVQVQESCSAKRQMNSNFIMNKLSREGDYKWLANGMWIIFLVFLGALARPVVMSWFEPPKPLNNQTVQSDILINQNNKTD